MVGSKIPLPAKYNKLNPDKKRLVRQQYIDLQKGKCWHCDCPLHEEPPKWIKSKKLNMLLFPVGFLDHPIHLQHNHKTGLTEGAVHAYCNGVLWQYHNR